MAQRKGVHEKAWGLIPRHDDPLDLLPREVRIEVAGRMYAHCKLMIHLGFVSPGLLIEKEAAAKVLRQADQEWVG